MAIDTSKPVECAENTFWVGYRNPNTMLQLNVYLRRFPGPRGTLNYVIDPGSPIDFPHISRKISQVIGNVANVHICSINHQDPDVGMNAIYLSRMNPKMLIITSEDNWRLLQHMDLDAKRVRLSDKFDQGRVRLGNHEELQYIMSYYCHFRGAMMTYDPQTRILYTGDLLGGLTLKKDHLHDLYASEQSWEGIVAFSAIYMPTNRALRLAVAAIRQLDPKPLIIAPQHGDIITGKYVDDFLTRIENLAVGVDLMREAEEKQDPKLLATYTKVSNEILRDAVECWNAERVRKKLLASHELEQLCELGANAEVTNIKKTPERALEVLLEALLQDEPEHETDFIKCGVLRSTIAYHLPIPSMEWEGTTDTAASGKVNL
ncbi:MAG: hypothetical protein R8L53_02160 [Mariprofundales bacterium]